MPILMGYGMYWALNENEGKQLTDQSVNLLQNIPEKHRKQIMEVMNTWLPLSAFMVTVGMITYPRLVLTRQELRGGPIPSAKGGDNNNVGSRPTESSNPATQASGENTEHNSRITPQREHPFANLVHS